MRRIPTTKDACYRLGLSREILDRCSKHVVRAKRRLVSSRLVLFLEVDRIKERTTSPEFTIVNPYLDSRLYIHRPRLRSLHMHKTFASRTVRFTISFRPSESSSFCILFNHPSLENPSLFLLRFVPGKPIPRTPS